MGKNENTAELGSAGAGDEQDLVGFDVTEPEFDALVGGILGGTDDRALGENRHRIRRQT